MQQADSAGKLIIVCGLPGSGKTTHAKQLEVKLRALRLCPDEWADTLSIDIWDEARRAKIEALQWEVGQQFLALGGTVIIEWGTWGRSERDALRVRARELGAAVELHYLAAPIDVLLKRTQQRQMESPAITQDQLQHWAQRIQVPTAEEKAHFDTALTLEGHDSA